MVEWKVPFVNYKIQTKIYGKEILKEIQRVMEGGDYILRKDVDEFEANLSELVGTKYAVSMNSCTDAMRLVFRALNFKRGAEVITSAHTFSATLYAIADAGLKPVLVDIGIDYNMDVSKIDDAVTNNTVAIMPVHLNGRCCSMQRVMNIAERYHLQVVEDAAQSLGAKFHDKSAGSFGIAGAFSFFPAKILGTIGDAGAVVTNDRKLAEQLKILRNHGQVKGQEQLACYGHNSRMDNVHAAILNYKLQFLPKWIARRRQIAWMYYSRLSKYLSDGCMQAREGAGHFDVYQNFPIRVHDRDRLVEYLKEKGIETLVSWRTPLHKQKALELGKYKLPMTEIMCDEFISLPMYPELTDSQVDYVCDIIIQWFKSRE